MRGFSVHHDLAGEFEDECEKNGIETIVWNFVDLLDPNSDDKIDIDIVHDGDYDQARAILSKLKNRDLE